MAAAPASLARLNADSKQRRLSHLAGREHRVNHHGLAAHVATREVGCGAETHPDRIDVEAVRVLPPSQAPAAQ